MHQLTIQIPENKIDFFRELVTNLGFKINGDVSKSILTDEQIELVNIERKKIKDAPGHFQDWDIARKVLKVD